MKLNKLAKIIAIPLIISLNNCATSRLERLEKRCNKYFEERTVEPSKFIKALQKYESQKLKVQEYKN